MKDETQPVLPVFPALTAPNFSAHMERREMSQAFDAMLTHPDCTAQFLADFLTGQKKPSLQYEVIDVHGERESPSPVGPTDLTWGRHMQRVFDAMCGAEDATFKLGLRVLEHAGFRSHFRNPPEFRGLAKLFQKMSLAEQLDVLCERVKLKGVETSQDRASESILQAMLRWVVLPADSRAAHLREWLDAGLTLGYHNAELRRKSLLSVLGILRREALAS